MAGTVRYRGWVGMGMLDGGSGKQESLLKQESRRTFQRDGCCFRHSGYQEGEECSACVLRLSFDVHLEDIHEHTNLCTRLLLSTHRSFHSHRYRPCRSRGASPGIMDYYVQDLDVSNERECRTLQEALGRQVCSTVVTIGIYRRSQIEMSR
jgi:hypothetical protein